MRSGFTQSSTLVHDIKYTLTHTHTDTVMRSTNNTAAFMLLTSSCIQLISVAEYKLQH